MNKVKMKREKENKSILSSIMNDLEVFYEEENKHLRELADTVVGSKGKIYVSARSIVFDSHFRIERVLNRTLIMLLGHGLRDMGFILHPHYKLIKEITELTFKKKLEIIKGLKIYSSYSIQIISSINTLRNDFAHPKNGNGSQYKYFNKSIFNRDTAKKLIGNTDEVRKEYIDRISQGGEVLLKK